MAHCNLPPLPPPCPASNQVANSQNWIRLSLGINIHGTQSMRDMLVIILHVPTNGKLFHSCLDTAKKSKKCNIQPFVWKNLLGACVDGCTRPCNGETNIDDLDITSLISIYNNAEFIIQSYVLSQGDIINIKLIYKEPVESIKKNRNELAHYSFKKSMTNHKFKFRWITFRMTLVKMGYTKLILFDELKTCFLDPYFEEKVKSFIDTLKVLEEEKCEKSELESFKSVVTLHITKCHNSNIKFKEELAFITGILDILDASIYLHKKESQNLHSYKAFF